jgi:glycerate kinase
VEAAQACGLHLLGPERRDPTRTTSRGLAVLLRAAVDTGAARVVVGLGGVGTCDGGAGLLAELGAGPCDVLAAGGGALDGTPDGALAGLSDVRSSLDGVELVAATDTDIPLLGFKGAAAWLAEGQGATPEQAQHLDRALGRFAQVALDALGPQRAPQRLVAEPGAGAAGGLGFGLLLLGARREIGAQAVLDAVGFADRLARADLVVTGEGTLDWQSLRGKVVAGVAHAALAVGVPTVVVAGQVQASRRELLAVGVETAYAVAETPEQVRAALADPAGTLSRRARRVARTWSPRR